MTGYLVIEAREREIALLLYALELAVRRQTRAVSRSRGRGATDQQTIESAMLADLTDMRDNFAAVLEQLQTNERGVQA